MKILIYGGNGWIGSMFSNILSSNNICYKKGLSRCNDEKELELEIEKFSPTLSFLEVEYSIVYPSVPEQVLNRGAIGD